MSDIKIAVIGLGYVGLPQDTLFAKKYNVAGYDVNKKRVEEFKNIDILKLKNEASVVYNIKNFLETKAKIL